jgi:hypothetical protein
MKRVRLFDPLLVRAAARALWVVALGTALGGCTSDTCPSTGQSLAPEPSINCQSGFLCYQGQCLRSCSPGQERAQSCEQDSDCDSVRPVCNNEGFCSACEGGQGCLPTLNVCDSVENVPTPNPPDQPIGGFAGQRPMDGGTIDGYVISQEPNPEPIPVLINPTFVGFVEAAVDVDKRPGGTTSTSLSVVAYDVKSKGTTDSQGVSLDWRPDISPVAQAEPFSDKLICGVVRFKRDGDVALPASMGKVTIRDAATAPTPPKAIVADFTATFVGNAYALDPGVGNPLLTLSRTGSEKFINVIGDPAPARFTPKKWPRNDAPNLHVPYVLDPTSSTNTLLQSGFSVSITTPLDQDFGWEPTSAGFDNESVRVRIQTTRCELDCRRFEDSSSVVPNLKIEAGVFRDLITCDGGVSPGQVLPVRFERSYSTSLPLDFDPETENIQIIVRFRYSLVTALTFAP